MLVRYHSELAVRLQLVSGDVGLLTRSSVFPFPLFHRGDNEVIRFLLTHPNVLQRCQRELKLKSANTSLAELDASGLLIPGSSASLELEVEVRRNGCKIKQRRKGR